MMRRLRLRSSSTLPGRSARSRGFLWTAALGLFLVPFVDGGGCWGAWEGSWDFLVLLRVHPKYSLLVHIISPSLVHASNLPPLSTAVGDVWFRFPVVACRGVPILRSIRRGKAGRASGQASGAREARGEPGEKPTRGRQSKRRKRKDGRDFAHIACKSDINPVPISFAAIRLGTIPS